MAMTKRMVAVAAAVAGGTVLALPGFANAADPAPVSAHARLASDWLAGETSGGIYLYGGSPDWGATADVAIAHAAAGAASGPGAEAVAALKANAPAATGTDSDIVSAAGTAKVALVAAIYGEDAANFGGVALPATLDSLIVTSGANAGLYSDGGEENPPFPNTFTQSYAVTAAARLGVGRASTVEWLLDQQCADGGFRIQGGAEPCESDVDATALVIQALEAARLAGVGDAAELGAAIDDGASFLVLSQNGDGSFASSGTWSTINTNTTGVAAQALRMAGQDAAADFATSWLISQQLNCEVVEADRGAFAYDEPGRLVAVGAASVPEGSRDSFRRATVQAVLGLGAPSIATLTAHDAPVTGYVPTCEGQSPTTPAPTTAAPTTSVPVDGETTTTGAPATTVPVDESTTTVPDGVDTTAGGDSNGDGSEVLGASETLGGSSMTGGSPLAYTGTSTTALVATGTALAAVGALTAAGAARLRRRSA